MNRTAFSLGVAALLVTSAAALHAQDTARALDPLATPALIRAPFTVDGALVRPASRAFQVVVTTDSGPRVVGMHSITISDAVHGGQPAWQVVEHRQSQAPYAALGAVDTVVLDRASLAPRRWEATSGTSRFVAAFANDTMYGGTTGPGIRKTFTTPVAPLTVTSEAALDVMLQSAALAPGWVADATMLVVNLGGPRLLPLRMVVEREERITVPAGEFDVWAVSVHAGAAAKWLWVDKRTQVVVKTAESPAHMRGLIVERVLATPQ